MARYFWERTNEAIPQAIAASRIYLGLAKSLPSHASEEKHMYLAWKDAFEVLAVKVVEECNNIDPAKAALLIEKKHDTWGQLNCLEMAAAALNRKFLSTVVCQNSVNFIWNQGVHCSIIVIFFAVFFPPLVFVPRLVRFQVPKIEGNSCSLDCKKLLTFYHAPKTKFVLNSISTFVTIVYYAAFLLFGFEKEIKPMEYVIFIIVLAFFVEEIREMFASKSDSCVEKINDWWHFSSWNRMDVIMVILGMVTIILRFATNTKYYYECKTMYVVTGAFLFLRVFRLYSVNPRLGPKLVMIKKMVGELLLYIAILAVALLTYGVCSQALLFPVRPFTWDGIKHIFYYPYWQIYGEIYLEAANAEVAGCGGNVTIDPKTGEMCPTPHWMVLIFLAVYLIIANVLLLNLLIAIFSNIFQEVQENSLEIWKFEMYSLVVEYETKPYLPFPFVVIEDIVRFFIFLFCLCPCRKGKDKKYVEDDEVKNDIVRFSNDAVNTYISQMESQHRQQVPVRLDMIDQRMEEVYRLLEDERMVHWHSHHVHHRQGSHEQTLARPHTADTPGETRPGTRQEGNTNPEVLKTWPDPVSVVESVSRKKMEGHVGGTVEAAAEAQLDVVREEKEREEKARRFEEELASPADGECCSLADSNPRNDLSGDLCRRLDDFENRTEAVLDNLRSALFEQQRKEKSGASKRRVQGLESRLANLEENTGRSLANIESLLRRILTGNPRLAALPEEEDEEEEEEDLTQKRRRGRRAFR